MSHQKVAVFDVDGTIFRSSLLVALVNRLIEEGYFPKEVRAQFEEPYRAWLDREGSYADYIKAVIRVFEGNIKGIHYAELMNAADHVIEEQQNQVYRYTRDAIAQYKREGYFLLAISHSPKMILEGFCKRMGFDKVYGMLYETGPENRFTGNHLEEHIIFNKANVLKRAVEKEGLTLGDSIGIGDTETDIAFLEMVDTPICFNPNRELHRYAQLNDWHIIVERKDVIYEF